MATKKPDFLTTQAAAADFIGVSTGWIKRLVSEGYIKRTGAKYDLQQVAQGYIRWLKDDSRRSSKTAAQSRMQDAKTAEIEMRVAERRRELVPMADAIALVDTVSGKVRSVMAGIPARCTRDLALRKTIDAQINAGLIEIADFCGKSAAAVAEGRDDDASGAGDDA